MWLLIWEQFTVTAGHPANYSCTLVHLKKKEPQWYCRFPCVDACLVRLFVAGLGEKKKRATSESCVRFLFSRNHEEATFSPQNHEIRLSFFGGGKGARDICSLFENCFSNLNFTNSELFVWHFFSSVYVNLINKKKNIQNKLFWCCFISAHYMAVKLVFVWCVCLYRTARHPSIHSHKALRGAHADSGLKAFYCSSRLRTKKVACQNLFSRRHRATNWPLFS